MIFDIHAFAFSSWRSRTTRRRHRLSSAIRVVTSSPLNRPPPGRWPCTTSSPWHRGSHRPGTPASAGDGRDAKPTGRSTVGLHGVCLSGLWNGLLCQALTVCSRSHLASCDWGRALISLYRFVDLVLSLRVPPSTESACGAERSVLPRPRGGRIGRQQHDVKLVAREEVQPVPLAPGRDEAIAHRPVRVAAGIALNGLEVARAAVDRLHAPATGVLGPAEKVLAAA